MRRWHYGLLTVALISIAAGAAAAHQLLGEQAQGKAPGQPVYPSSPPPTALVTAPAVPAAPMPTSTPSASRLPARLIIPKLGVDAAVERVGLDANGNVGVPASPQDVAWYELGPAPGEAGSAVIDGHLDWTSGPAVFYNLWRLRPGDEIQVQLEDGKVLRFLVTGSNLYAATERPPADLFASWGPPRLSLITCAGLWDAAHRSYRERLVVTTLLATGS